MSEDECKETLRQLKASLRGEFLGKHGIHGMGMRSAEDAICIYLQPGVERTESEAIARLRERVAPHKLIIVEDDAASIGDG
ncbi:hypothetical protein [Planctomycetes bacterium Pan216]